MKPWTVDDICDQVGRVAVVTGSNAGLGFQIASALAAKGGHVVLAVRDLDRGKDAAARIVAAHPEAQVSLQELDLASLKSIRLAAEQLQADHQRIDLLVNNAGVVYTPKTVTEDGFELHFGTNYLGHFALTGLLLESLRKVEGSRVVTVSSLSHRIRAAIHFDDLHWQQRYSRVGAYAQSKLANLLFAYELQRRLNGEHTISVAAHPGCANTDLARGRSALARMAAPLGALLLQKPQMGALPILRAATDPGAVGGQYYGPARLGQVRGFPRVVASNATSYDSELARRLWTVSEELTGVIYPHTRGAAASNPRTDDLLDT